MTAILIEADEVLGGRDENPNTSDRLINFIIIFMISMIGFISTTFMYTKKKFER